ncbi:MAG: MaoC family dehydratase [Christiangramia sp.]|nr:MaoC family dehydratase [Christiangramia sp.]
MLELGQRVSIEKVFNEAEVLNFSEMSMDDNPIHFDEGYAERSRFKQRIVQGPFVLSLIGGLLGSKLPGPGTIYINQNVQFLKPVYIGDKVQANIEIKEIRADKPIIKLRTWVEKENGSIVIDGEAVVLFMGETN